MGRWGKSVNVQPMEAPILVMLVSTCWTKLESSLLSGRLRRAIWALRDSME